MCNQYEYTPDICIRSITLQHSRGFFTASELGRRRRPRPASDMLLQQWLPLTCLVLSHSSRRLVAQEPPWLPQVSISVYSCEDDYRVLLVGFAVGAVPSLDGLVLSDPASRCLAYGAVGRRSTSCGRPCVVRLIIIWCMNLPKIFPLRFLAIRQEVLSIFNIHINTSNVAALPDIVLCMYECNTRTYSWALSVQWYNDL